MEIVAYNGWKNNVRLSNNEIELIVTKDVGPRIIRFGFIGERNVFAEFKNQQGKTGEREWMIRGGHRLWIAPEEKPKSYELDNGPIRTEEIRDGVRTLQPAGPLSKMRKVMEISLSSKSNDVTVIHKLCNTSKKTVELSAWGLSVMAPRGVAIIPLPEKVPHTKLLTHNQQWSLWGYTDLTDPRFTIGQHFILFRQDATRGPNKLGLANREGWAAYLLSGYLFIKRFKMLDRTNYPDGGVNFETFSNEQMLEIESLGPLVSLPPNKCATHEEKWSLFRNVPSCKTEADVLRYIIPIVTKLR
jgi:hypothetical protein